VCGVPSELRNTDASSTHCDGTPQRLGDKFCNFAGLQKQVCSTDCRFENDFPAVVVLRFAGRAASFTAPNSVTAQRTSIQTQCRSQSWFVVFLEPH
jgi:hypothetical protein